jgi:uncharacterized peroxidase-related enzyme
MSTVKTEPRVSRLRVPEPEELPADIQRFFKATEAAEGYVPNWLRAFALGKGHFTRNNAYLFPLLLGSPDSTSTLTVREREILGTVVSVDNRCAYCHAFHVDGLAKAIGDERLAHRIAMAPNEVEELSERERLLAEFAITVTRTPGEVSDAQLEGLRAIGLSDVDIYEALQIAAVINATNRLSIALGVLPDAQTFAAPTAPAHAA